MPAGWDDATEVLCVRLDTIGDVLMTTPAIRALRSNGRRITLLTSPSGAEAARLVPEVDDVLTATAPWMKVDAPEDLDPLVSALRDRRFDAAVICTVSTQSAWPAALVCLQAGIPRRLAYLREKPYHVLTDPVPDPEPDRCLRHEVRRQLDLVAAVGCTIDDERLSIGVPEGAASAVDRMLGDAGLHGDRPWAVIHPGASAPSRRYPAEGFVEVARLLASGGWGLAFSGDEEEATLVEEIVRASAAEATSFAGRLSVAELAALLHRAPVLVSNNTGPVHVAAAVGTPVVDVYALTNPQHTPWGVPSEVLSRDVPCRNCLSSICLVGHHRCVRDVAPADVAAAAQRLAR